MDDPASEIARTIDLCAGAPSPDAQILAFEHYFTADASFLHPLCYVPSGPDSRRRIMQIYIFYRAIIPKTSFEIQSVAFDDKKGQLFVSLIQRPELLIWRNFYVLELPMMIHFHVRREGEEQKWLIERQEDLVQARNVLLILPGLRWFGAVLYFFFRLAGLLNARLLTTMGLWRPIEYREKVF